MLARNFFVRILSQYTLATYQWSKNSYIREPCSRKLLYYNNYYQILIMLYTTLSWNNIKIYIKVIFRFVRYYSPNHENHLQCFMRTGKPKIMLHVFDYKYRYASEFGQLLQAFLPDLRASNWMYPTAQSPWIDIELNNMCK